MAIDPVCKKNQKNISGDERRPYMQRKYLHKAIIITSFLLTISFISTGAALAHKGHGGPAKIFMQEADALKTMLPKGEKILKRKEVLKKEKVSEAIKQWGYSPSEGAYTYFISKGSSGDLSGLLFIQSIEYKHGSIGLAVGYDKGGHVSDIKILSCPEKYVKELSEQVQDSGFLEGFLHLSTSEVVNKAKNAGKEAPESIRQVIANEIGNTSILLKVFQGL